MLEGNNPRSVVTNVCVFGCGFLLGYVVQKWIKSVSSPKPKDMDEKATAEGIFSDFGHSETKLVLVVQNGLKMGKGKIAAQCSHASVMAYQYCASKNPPVLKKWLKSGQRKVVVKVDDEESMLELAHKARQIGVMVSIVCDAGKTQIPSGSKTVLAVGPGEQHILDKITGHLKLL